MVLSTTCSNQDESSSSGGSDSDTDGSSASGSDDGDDSGKEDNDDDNANGAVEADEKQEKVCMDSNLVFIRGRGFVQVVTFVRFKVESACGTKLFLSRFAIFRFA